MGTVGPCNGKGTTVVKFAEHFNGRVEHCSETMGHWEGTEDNCIWAGDHCDRTGEQFYGSVRH